MSIVVPPAEELAARLEKLIAERQVVGATVAVLVDGAISDAAAGFVNQRTGVEATTDSLFQIGSISKVWAATIAMQLVGEGVLDLDEPVVGYLPELRLADPEQTSAVTVAMLLNHTSGIGGDWFADAGRGDDCLERYVAQLGDLGFGYAPGSRFSYCNAGWAILGRVIEVMAGEPWDAVLRRRLIEPLGLTHCVTLPEEAILHRAAAGHFRRPDKNGVEVAPLWALPRSMGPAGSTLTMTASDLVRFAQFHLDGGIAPAGNRLLELDLVARMQRPSVDLSDLSFFPGLDGWGFGWMLFDWGGTRVVGHDGATAGQVATLRVAPALGMAVAMMANTVPGGAQLFHDATEWLWGEIGGVDVPAQPAPKPAADRPVVDPERYVGTYERPGVTIEVTIAAQGGMEIDRIPAPQLAPFVPPQPAQALVPHEVDLFLTAPLETDAWSPVVFMRDRNAARATFIFDGGRLAARA
ncbi:MAG: serine hydrolase domain-containing protein [Acidimicrobiales bacterium]